MTRANPGLVQPQKFPIYYPAEAEFQADNGGAGVPGGAVATLTFSITTRPFALVGIRWRNLYEIPQTGVEFVDPDGQNAQRFYPPDLVDYFARLDNDQDLTVELAQQNIVIRPTNGQLVQGNDGIHYHPFPCPFPFRGGNNVTCTVRRRTAYPAELLSATVQATLIGWQYVTDADPGGHPPSTGFPPGHM